MSGVLVGTRTSPSRTPGMLHLDLAIQTRHLEPPASFLKRAKRMARGEKRKSEMRLTQDFWLATPIEEGKTRYFLCPGQDGDVRLLITATVKRVDGVAYYEEP